MTFSGAVPGRDGQPLDQIRLTGVTATGHHGVLAHERAEGQVFRADVVLHVDARAAAAGDDLAATVSYAEVAQDVHDVLAGRPADLIETVAERIAAAALAYPAVQAVDVRVHKPQAPIAVPFDDVEVAIRRDRVRTPVVSAVMASAAEAPGAGVPSEPVVAAAPSQSAALAEPDLATHPDAAAEPATAFATGAPAVEPFSAGAPGEVPATAPPVDAPTAPFEPVAAVPPAPAGPPAPEPAPEPEAPSDPLDEAPTEPVEAVLALGANLGEAQATLRQAVTDIDRIVGLQVMEVSPLARTAAVGGPEQPDFLNAVLLVRTTLSPRELLHACQRVEEQHGRVREEHWGPRTLDVDIVQYGSLVATAHDLELPHPRARERAFVLVPWAEAAPDAVLHGLGGGPVAQLAATAPDRTGIRWLALDWLADPQDTVAPPSAPPAQYAPAIAPGTGPVPSSAPLPPRPASGAQPVQPPVPPQRPAHPPVAHEPIPPAPDSAFAPRSEQWAPPSDPPFPPSADPPYVPPSDAVFPRVETVFPPLPQQPYRPPLDDEHDR